jgi:hypothetical protein
MRNLHQIESYLDLTEDRALWFPLVWVVEVIWKGHASDGGHQGGCMGGGANQWRAHKRWRPLRRACDTGASLGRSRRRWRCRSRTRRVVLAIRMEGGGRWIWCGTLVHGLFLEMDIFLTKAGILTIFVKLSLLISIYRGVRLARLYKSINKHMHLKWRAL